MPESDSKTVITPLYIRLHENDNVAIVANSGGLPAGTVFECGLKLEEAIPQGHKIALKDFIKDEKILSLHPNGRTSFYHR